ncbi:hypothetical protein EM308_11190 [Flavobacterium gilvum]|uniref:Thioredoxin domain-containing protein n=2 Tax=Flavobacterium gilvum TaxID=1492737 RepID=A0AAC9I390_9FLAO|nr:hypothetical protein EM308_11190 [Flavobacterium gilvum]
MLLKTEKIKGFGMMGYGALPLEFSDISKFNDFSIMYPKNINKIRIAYELIDFKPSQYSRLKKNKSEYLTSFLKSYVPQKIDTSNIPKLKDNTFVVLTGEQNGHQIFIVDENNNKDLRDDSIRSYKNLKKIAIQNKPIKVKYNIYNGAKLVEDFGWVIVAENKTNTLSLIISRHLESSFTIGKNTYKVQVINGLPFYRFCFENPIIALVGQNGVYKDSIMEGEKINQGEYLKLENKYYRFDDVSNDGRFIKLVIENNVGSKVGTQVGFIAPTFNCRTIDNDSILSSNYKRKYMLLANVSPCWSEKSSYEYFKELSEAYGSQISILGIDNSPNILEQNIKNLKLNGPFVIADNNPTIKNSYRKDFCSRTCFLINPEGRIIDKFEIDDWKTRLKETIGDKQ